MATEETLASVWEQHVGAEFGAKSADQAHETMTADPYVNAVPLMIGGRRRDGVRNFYANHFVSQVPPDVESAAQVLNPMQPMNELIRRAVNHNG